MEVVSCWFQAAARRHELKHQNLGWTVPYKTPPLSLKQPFGSTTCKDIFNCVSKNMRIHTSHKIHQLASPPALEMEPHGAGEVLWNARRAIPSEPYPTQHPSASLCCLGEKNQPTTAQSELLSSSGLLSIFKGKTNMGNTLPFRLKQQVTIFMCPEPKEKLSI